MSLLVTSLSLTLLDHFTAHMSFLSPPLPTGICVHFFFTTSLYKSLITTQVADHLIISHTHSCLFSSQVCVSLHLYLFLINSRHICLFLSRRQCSFHLVSCHTARHRDLAPSAVVVPWSFGCVPRLEVGRSILSATPFM